jgi:RNA polymerase sigma factor (TIGR02999 family)
MDGLALLFQRLTSGDDTAINELLPQVYAELRQLAAGKLAWERAAHTLAPTALVNEAYLRLFGDKRPKFESKRHFFAAASEAMRRVLIEHARRRQALKRGGQGHRLDLNPDEFATKAPDERLMAVDEAVEQLRAVDPQAAEVVMLRYFAGLSLPEAAEILQVAPRTADRLWAFAKTWLYAQIEKS